MDCGQPEASDLDNAGLDTEDVDACAPAPLHVQVTMAEEEDENPKGQCYMEACPDEQQTGATFGTKPTQFQAIQDDQILKGFEILGPFKDED